MKLHVILFASKKQKHTNSMRRTFGISIQCPFINFASPLRLRHLVALLLFGKVQDFMAN
jgi:hypothetical protein